MSESEQPAETATADEQRRLAAVRGYQILDTPPDGAFDRVARLAARIFDVPMATVTIVDEDRIWFKATQGLPGGATQVGRDPGLCASAILQDEPYIIPDALREPWALENPLVRGELGIRFYTAAPIICEDGYRLGTVNVLDTQPHRADAENVATLQTLAAVVAEQLELHLAGIRAVQHQEANLRAVLHTRADTDHAVGMIMATRHCDADTAWRVLQQLSQDTNIKVRVIAETMAHILDGVDPTTLDQVAYHTALRALSSNSSP